MRVKAMVKNLGVSPKKLGLIVDMVRGKGVAEAMDILRFMPSPAGKNVAKVVKSASANAENNFQMDPAKLKIAEIYANLRVCVLVASSARYPCLIVSFHPQVISCIHLRYFQLQL